MDNVIRNNRGIDRAQHREMSFDDIDALIADIETGTTVDVDTLLGDVDRLLADVDTVVGQQFNFEGMSLAEKTALAKATDNILVLETLAGYPDIPVQVFVALNPNTTDNVHRMLLQPGKLFMQRIVGSVCSDSIGLGILESTNSREVLTGLKKNEKLSPDIQMRVTSKLRTLK